MLNLRRCKPLALALLAAPALLLADAAHGAMLELIAHGHDAFVCQATTWNRYTGGIIAQTPRFWVNDYPSPQDIGDLPIGTNGDSPAFGGLALRCWIATPYMPGTDPHAGQPSYTLTLAHDDAAWTVHHRRADLTWNELPRGGHVLGFVLARTASEAYPIGILIARMRLNLDAGSHDVVYGPQMHRYFEPY